MNAQEQHPPGTFCWALLASDDPTGSRNFYNELFGWQAPGNDLPTPLFAAGQHVAALDRLPPELEENGVPSQWRSFVCVDDVEDVARRAGELGGTVLGEPRYMLDWGRAVPVFDPQGSPVALWEPRELAGADRTGVAGSTCWRELHAHDVDAAEAFYCELFGWKADRAEAAGVDYVTFSAADGTEVAGLQQQRPEWGDAPPTWLCYFGVESLKSETERLGEIGGRLVGGPLEHPRGEFAVAHDPQDAVFGLLELSRG